MEPGLTPDHCFHPSGWPCLTSCVKIILNDVLRSLQIQIAHRHRRQVNSRGVCTPFLCAVLVFEMCVLNLAMTRQDQKWLDEANKLMKKRKQAT